jgi:hypothetical protein
VTLSPIVSPLSAVHLLDEQPWLNPQLASSEIL